MLNQDSTSYHEAYAAVLYHDSNKSCSRAMKSYRELLTNEAQPTLLDWPLSGLLDTWKTLVETAEQRSWLQEFRLRYWNTDASEAAWDLYNTAKAEHPS